MAVIKKPRLQNNGDRKFRSRQQFDSNEAEQNLEYEPTTTTTTAPLESVSLEEIRKQKAKYNENCFGCRWRFSKPVDPDKQPQMFKLYECLVKNHGKMSPQALYQLVSKTQDNLFRKPFLGTDCTNIPMLWTPEMIEEHLKDHGCLIELELEDDYRNLKQICDFLMDNIGKKDPTRKDPIPDLDMIKTYRDIRRDKEALAIKLGAGRK